MNHIFLYILIFSISNLHLYKSFAIVILWTLIMIAQYLIYSFLKLKNKLCYELFDFLKKKTTNKQKYYLSCIYFLIFSSKTN